MASILKTSVTANTSGLVDGTIADASDVLNPITDLLTHVKQGRMSVTAADLNVKHLNDAIVAGTGIAKTLLNPGGDEQISLSASNAIVPYTVLGSDTAWYDFTSIPAAYDHLRLVLGLRTAFAAALDSMVVRCNNDSAVANYASLAVNIQHSSALATQESLEGWASGGHLINAVAGGTSPAGYLGVMTLDFYEYAKTGRPRTCHWRGLLRVGNASGEIRQVEGCFMWKNTANAINRIVISSTSGSNIVAGSGYALYGVR